MENVPLPAAPRRRRRRFWLGSLVVIVLGVAGYWLTQMLRQQAGERRLHAAMAVAAADMPDWQWGEHFESGAPKLGADNVARDITHWMLRRSLTESAPRTARPKWVQDFENWEGRIFSEGNYPLGLGLTLYPERGLPEQARSDLRVIFGQEVTQADLEMLRRWKDRPPGRYEYRPKGLGILLLLPMAQKIRQVANIFAWDAVWQSDQGRNDLALADVQTLAMLTRSFGDDPILICQLIRMAVGAVGIKNLERVLAQSAQIDSKILEKIQAEYLAESERPILLAMARGIRALEDRDMALLATDVIQRDRLKNFFVINGRAPVTPFEWLNPVIREVWERLFLFPSAAAWPQERALVLEYHNRFVDLARQPEKDWLRGCEAFVIPQEKAPFLHTVTNSFGSPGFSIDEKITKALLKYRSQLRCAATACAAERFRLQNGRWPRDWSELTPHFLPVVQLDAFTQKPLLWKVVPDGLVIYSVGLNEQDDDGYVLETEAGMPKDSGFRLWSPESRRKGLLPTPRKESE